MKPQVKVWKQRMHVEINYDLPQFLTGHGGYSKYLYRFKLDSSPNYTSCDGIPEDPEHVFLHCPRFAEERNSLEEDTIIGKTLACQESWKSTNDKVGQIQCKLREPEEGRMALLRMQSMVEGRA